MGISSFFADLKAAANSGKVSRLIKVGLLEHTVHMVFLIRLGQSVSRLPIIGRLLQFLFEYLIRVIYSSDVSLKASIDKGFVLSHGHDIVIGADVKIGINCRLFNGVTLGNRDLSKPSTGNQPTIKNNVVLCTGAKILGPVTLNDGVVIGANSVVLKDCDSGFSYVGIPAKKISK